MIDLEHLERTSVDDLRLSGGSKWADSSEALDASVAEMDFGCAPPVLRALRDAIDSLGFGYLSADLKATLAQACGQWIGHRFRWDLPPERIRPVTDVLSGFERALALFSPADRPAVIVPTPCYPVFLSILRALGRPVIELPLSRQVDRWVLDPEALEAAFAAGGGLLVLCNPHNPTGTVSTVEEHRAVAEIVERHRARVFSDEIHAPLVYTGHTHVPYASSCPEAAGHTVTAVSAAKGWNIPGLKAAQIIFSNPTDLRLWVQVGGSAEHSTSTLGVIASVAAYTAGGQWLDGVTRYLRANRDHLVARLADEMPQIAVARPEATYFAWLDMQHTGLGDSPAAALLERAGVAVDGRDKGEGFQQFVRFNFATPRHILDAMLDRIGEAL